MRIVSLLSAATVASVVTPASRPGIIRRHDVADSVYLQAATQLRGLVHIDLSTKPTVGDGEGTLVAPQWVLTAAHVAAEVKTGHQVTLGDTRRSVDRVCMHPDAAGDPPSDLALLHLAAPLTGAAVVPLYRGTDEVSQVVWIGGYGDNGDGRGGPVVADRRVRAATNRVDEVTSHWMIFAFDPPGSPRATPLEGISGPGDSGGPAYLVAGGQWFVAGVSSRQDIGPTGGKQGRYGVRELYARVSTNTRWIDATMAGGTCARPAPE